ncbi:MAG: hypothetical protein ACHRHE_10265 [Tepidisphaerales bacterium]
MSSQTRQLRSFVARLHRRLLVVRLLECTGIGLLGGALAALVVLGVLLWQGRSAASPAVVLLSLGAVTGLVWGWTRRPSSIVAAEEADRQLDLADLLSTAFALVRSAGQADDEFARTVLGLADTRCRSASPSQVILGRLGRRSWGAITLSLMLVGGLSLLSANPLEGDPALASVDGLGGSGSPASRNALLIALAPGIGGPIAADHPTGTNEDPANTDPERANTSKHAAGNGGNTSSNAGGGTGSAQTGTHSNTDPANSGGTAAAQQNHTGETASGVGASANNPGGRGPNGSSRTGGGRNVHVPAWRSPDWPSVSDQATQGVRTGRIPPAYHDLVQKYFERE